MCQVGHSQSYTKMHGQQNVKTQEHFAEFLSGNFLDADRCLLLKRKTEVEGVKRIGSDHVYRPAAPRDREPCAPLRFHG